MSNRGKNIIVIGAGVVGCAIACRLSKLNYSVYVLEKNSRIADEVTSRNSGVIHAGLYYPPDSLKAKSCISGNEKLYKWCEERSVTFKRTGKWIVGSRDDENELMSILKNANDSGAKRLRKASNTEIKMLNDIGINADIAVFSELSGIVDPYEYTNSFRIEAEKNGTTFVLNTEVLQIIRKNNGFIIESSNGEIETDFIINCAGLYSDEVHKMLGYTDIKIYPYRGDYFRVKKDLNCPYLIYPTKKKNDPGLGVHLTIDLDGRYRLGPDVSIAGSKTSFQDPDSIEQKKESFWMAGRKILKDLNLEDLAYDSCGIRPKLRSYNENVEKDFILKPYEEGYIAFLGIESPGLTSAIDLADRALDYLPFK
ncbi:MAG: NAD(P)/FAD-dependent oxidoreductase [Oligoflexia bacterium]|nr:NAD(P)/FAD-dependent oxidoreductase [Oligoflexia bacterium]